MIVRKLRLQRGWSQDQLAEFTGLSVRTIQRLERGTKPSLETARALAAVFEVDHSSFMQEDEPMTTPEPDVKVTATGDKHVETATILQEEREALRYAKRLKAFYEGLIVYLILLVVAFGFSDRADDPVVYGVFIGVGVGLAVQGLMAYEVIRFDFPSWEKRIVEKRLGRKL